MVVAKQTWTEPLDKAARKRGFLGWHQRGHLPHFDVPGIVQFVTFRLCDALPADRRPEWQALLKIEEDRERRQRLEEWLDRGFGECWMRQPRIARIAEDALCFFNNQRYQLHAWVIMPNHVHVVVHIWETPLASLLMSWKRFIAREANKLLKREGRFWEREYWDTWMRDENQLRRAVNYTEANPVKGGLVREAKDWLWGSARFRDKYGGLRLPAKHTS